MLFSVKKNGKKSPKTVEKPRFARNRRDLQETAQDLPGAPQIPLQNLISKMALQIFTMNKTLQNYSIHAYHKDYT